MKKRMLFLLIIIAVCSLSVSMTIFAEDKDIEIKQEDNIEQESNIDKENKTEEKISYEVGELINHTLHTDIAAYINHYPIKSYNIDGHTAIIAEDLIDYGFDVIWDGEEKTLSISRNYDILKITPKYKLYSENKPVGSPYLDVYFTDIITYVDDEEVPSYNVGGRTIIQIDNLDVFGEVVWVSDVRAIKVWLEGLPYIDFEFIPTEPMFERYPNTEFVTYSSVTKSALLDMQSAGGAISYQYRYDSEQLDDYLFYLRGKDYQIVESKTALVTSLQITKGNEKFAVAYNPSQGYLWIATEDRGSREIYYYLSTELPSYTSVTDKECNYTVYFDGTDAKAGYVEDGEGFVYSYDKTSFDRYTAFLIKLGFNLDYYDYNVQTNEMTYFCKKGEVTHKIVISYTYNQIAILIN